jgi:hypothetical protein
MRQINKMVVFSNAGVQSVRKATKSLKNDPLGFAYRTAVYSVIPQLFFAGLRKASGDDGEEYRQMNATQRDMFYNFKTPFTGDAWISIPKPYELGLVASGIDRLISQQQGEENAFDGFFGTTYKTLLPFDESSIYGGFKPLVEARMNRNIYTGNQIVPEHEANKKLVLRKNTKNASLISQKTSNAFKAIGAEIDPRYIDHILKGYGTYFARQGLAVGDLFKDKEEVQTNFWITQSGFAHDVPSYSAKSVKAATDLAKSLGESGSKKSKKIRTLIDDFQTEKDLGKRKIIIKRLYNLSKAYRAELERLDKRIDETGVKPKKSSRRPPKAPQPPRPRRN